MTSGSSARSPCPVRLALARPARPALDWIERVYSHAQALVQADAFLRSRAWQVMTTYNTAGAGADDRRAARATARRPSPRRGSPALYGLEILADDIQAGDGEPDAVRRARAGRRPAPTAGDRAPAGTRRTGRRSSFAVRNVPGSLAPLPRRVRGPRGEPVVARVAAGPRARAGSTSSGSTSTPRWTIRRGRRPRRPPRGDRDGPGPRLVPARRRGLTARSPGPGPGFGCRDRRRSARWSDRAGAGPALRGVERVRLLAERARLDLGRAASSLMNILLICQTTNAITMKAMIALMNAPQRMATSGRRVARRVVGVLQLDLLGC